LVVCGFAPFTVYRVLRCSLPENIHTVNLHALFGVELPSRCIAVTLDAILWFGWFLVRCCRIIHGRCSLSLRRDGGRLTGRTYLDLVPLRRVVADGLVAARFGTGLLHQPPSPPAPRACPTATALIYAPSHNIPRAAPPPPPPAPPAFMAAGQPSPACVRADACPLPAAPHYLPPPLVC